MTGAGWVFPACDLCGETAGSHILRLHHPDAPGGATFIRECQGCGLKRLWPRPGQEILQRYYGVKGGACPGRQRSSRKQALWDLWRDGAAGAPRRGKALRLLAPFFRTIGDHLFDINVVLDREVPPRILDIGCGFGDLLIYWQSRGAEAIGIDFDARAAELAKKLKVTVIHGDPLDQNLVAGLFDVVTLNHSLEHFPSPQLILKRAAELLKPHGELHLAVPNIASAPFHFLRQHWEGISLPIHFWFFEPDTITKLLEKTGFQNIRLMTKYSQQFVTLRVKAALNLSELPIFWKILKFHVSGSGRGDIIKVVVRKP
jgi:SAM-dependent methyltransferase